MFSISKSRYTLALQLTFLVINAIGIFVATIYNATTPDLYPNNAHHKIGWIITSVVVAQFSVALTARLADAWRRRTSQKSSEQLPFLPVHTLNRFESRHGDAVSHQGDCAQQCRFSDDIGQENGSNTESLRSSTASTMCGDYGDVYQHVHKDLDHDDEFEAFFTSARMATTANVAHKIVKGVARSAPRYLALGYKAVDRIVLPLGFIALTTGVVTFGRFFVSQLMRLRSALAPANNLAVMEQEGKSVFNGLAHWIKGGVFFWLGLFTLGRWCGSFAELGWAWNLRPTTGQDQMQKFRPSAEFIESALIFLYGATNIFLEHVGGWGGAWTAQDLEHLAITVLFLGGGLVSVLLWLQPAIYTFSYQ